MFTGGRFSKEAREGVKHYRQWLKNPDGSWKDYKAKHFDKIASAIQKKKKYINDNSTSNTKQTRADREFLEESFKKLKPSLAKEIASRTRTEEEKYTDEADAIASRNSRIHKQKIITDDLLNNYPNIKEKKDIIIDKNLFIIHYRTKKQSKLNKKYGTYKNGKPKKRAYLSINEKGYLMDCYKKMIPPKLNYDDLYLPGHIETGTIEEGKTDILTKKPDQEETKGTSRKNYTKVRTNTSQIQEDKKEEKEYEDSQIYKDEYKTYSEDKTKTQVSARLALLKQRREKAYRDYQLAKRAGNVENSNRLKKLWNDKVERIKAIKDVLNDEFD